MLRSVQASLLVSHLFPGCASACYHVQTGPVAAVVPGPSRIPSALEEEMAALMVKAVAQHLGDGGIISRSIIIDYYL